MSTNLSELLYRLPCTRTSIRRDPQIIISIPYSMCSMVSTQSFQGSPLSYPQETTIFGFKVAFSKNIDRPIMVAHDGINQINISLSPLHITDSIYVFSVAKEATAQLDYEYNYSVEGNIMRKVISAETLLRKKEVKVKARSIYFEKE